jgi:hypothetical protein
MRKKVLSLGGESLTITRGEQTWIAQGVWRRDAPDYVAFAPDVDVQPGDGVYGQATKRQVVVTVVDVTLLGDLPFLRKASYETMAQRAASD